VSDRPLPNGWRWVKLGTLIVDTRNGLYKPDEFYGRGTPILKMFNIGRLDGTWHLDRVDQIQLTATEQESYRLSPGDILLNRVNSRELVGKCAVINDSTDGFVFESKNMRLRLSTVEANPWFVVYWLNSAECRRKIETSMKQIVGQATLNRADLDNLEIPLPPLSEQQLITVVLADQMAAVERARAAAEAELEAARALSAAYLREVFESEEAQEWPRVPLRDVLKRHTEIVHPYDKPIGHATFVGLEHIESHTGIRTGSVDLDMSQLTGRKPKFYKGQIVYGYLRPYLNKVWIAEFDGLCSVDQYIYSVDPCKAMTEFIAWFMLSPFYMDRSPVGSNTSQLPRIRADEVESVEINLPPLETQNQVLETMSFYTAEIARIRTSLEQQIEAINKLPAALLHRAFRGTSSGV
jgi:restriction endonuclease S subunit